MTLKEVIEKWELQIKDIAIDIKAAKSEMETADWGDLCELRNTVHELAHQRKGIQDVLKDLKQITNKN